MKGFVFSLLVIGFALSVASADEILIKGSDTLLNLVQQLAERYMESHPDAEISVVGGGSGVGIAALIDNKVDIANSSRKIKPGEIKRAEERGINPVEFIIAMDGLSIIVNPENPVDKLTMEQLGAIYRGEIRNWKDVGGPKMRINLYGRQPSSGTFIFFREHVLRGDYSPRMRQMTGNAQIVEAVKHDRSGIGYVGLGYVKGAEGIKVLKIGKREKGRPLRYLSPLLFLTPSKPGVRKPDPKDYPLIRPLQQYTNGVPKGMVRDFILFEIGDEGQKVVEKVGFLRIAEKQKAKDLRVLEGNR